ncbi:MAG TPA: hypothetical protein VGR02_10980 [Thermoanaerobaculia bacterium]|jgi:hypothetical protein|nr:hypothetical protein [Thermoanaerobaculia bacterium]
MTNMTTTTVDRDAPFGFGAFTPLAPTFIAVVSTKARLIEELNKLASLLAPPTTLALEPGVYDFTGDFLQRFVIRGKNVTIEGKRGARVVLQNFGLILPVNVANNVLIQDLHFRSNGDRSTSPRDAIDLTAMVPTGLTTTTQSTALAARVRITHCSFDGYFDIGVYSRTYAGAPRLLATIDQCLFFDANPGKPADVINDVLAFTNRGAINFDSLEDPNRTGTKAPQLVGNARATVAYNVFVNVWRRCPRIATGNFGYVFNNFLYQWGFGNDGDGTQGTSTWSGMVVGGGRESSEGGPTEPR